MYSKHTEQTTLLLAGKLLKVLVGFKKVKTVKLLTIHTVIFLYSVEHFKPSVTILIYVRLKENTFYILRECENVLYRIYIEHAYVNVQYHCKNTKGQGRLG
jgi:hypothetical protein